MTRNINRILFHFGQRPKYTLTKVGAFAQQEYVEIGRTIGLSEVVDGEIKIGIKATRQVENL